MGNATNRTFILDGSVQITVEFDGNRAFQIWYKNARGITKEAVDLFGMRRYGNVKAAINFLMKEPAAQSATTDCGITVSRG